MTYLLHGALIEYGSDFLGPLPNVVIFQFNPETISRTIQIPERSNTGTHREVHQAADPPTEEISLKAEFCAADQLNSGNVLARTFGIGPQLAALEKMVYPSNKIGGLIGAAIDAIGSALGGDSNPATQPVPREQLPRLLFIWGPSRVLPVAIKSMSITEQQYDNLLNPIQAEVSLTLEVFSLQALSDPCSKDAIGTGALEYSNLAKEAQAILNLANTAEQIVELIPF